MFRFFGAIDSQTNTSKCVIRIIDRHPQLAKLLIRLLDSLLDFIHAVQIQIDIHWYSHPFLP